jgi:ABC-2 type transport system ATP-binding protein
MTAAITASGLRKSYGGTAVLDGVDLTVPEGTVHALLGPNGAGKTTTVEILTTYLRADAGTATVGERDVAADADGVRRAIGVTGQSVAVDGLLTGVENLQLMADLRHLGRRAAAARLTDLVARFGLGDVAGRRAATYSGGERRRLDVAMTLVGDPRILFLDEPTTGLDPRSRRTTWDVVRELVAAGTTVLLTTQYLEEADQLADGISVLDGGRIVARGTADELKRRVGGGHARLVFADAAALDAAAAVLGGVRDGLARALTVPTDADPRAVRTLLDRLDAAGTTATGLTVHTPDLDDVFLALTGRARAEVAA